MARSDTITFGLNQITVDPETYPVTADGEALLCAPAKTLPLAQRYQLF